MWGRRGVGKWVVWVKSDYEDNRVCGFDLLVKVPRPTSRKRLTPTKGSHFQAQNRPIAIYSNM